MLSERRTEFAQFDPAWQLRQDELTLNPERLPAVRIAAAAHKSNKLMTSDGRFRLKWAPLGS
jgi:hypothetical protein